MKKGLLVLCATWCLVLVAGAAWADSITGRVGVTGRIGFLVPADSSPWNTDVGFVGGGGFIYGINRDWAAELDITTTSFDGHAFNKVSFDTTNVALGAQYRFKEMSKFTPYFGFGLDILMNGSDKYDVDTVLGAHVGGGVDYFLMKNLALTSEMKFVIAPDADVMDGNVKRGNFDPSSFVMTFGARYFFN